VLLAAFAILVAVEAALFAFVYLPGERAQAVEAWKGRLAAIADDRESALAAWVRERTADAHVVAAYPTVVALAAAGAGAPPPASGGEGTETHLSGLLATFVQAYRYQGAYVLDARGAEVARSTGSPPLCEACLAAARGTLAAGTTTLDFYLRSDGTSLIAVMAPVATPAPGAPSQAPVGAVVLTADPGGWVYPMLLAQPVPTSTGETVLVRREGDRVRFLSPLRYRNAAPLTYSRPLDTPGFAAQEVVEGRHGFFAYTDYRDAPVFAATRTVPGTRWGLVVKVDRAEALAPFREDARAAILFLALVTAGLALAGLSFWRSRRAHYEAALARSEARFADLFEQANDAIVVSRPDGRIVAANARAEALYGYPRAELLALAIHDLRAPETLPQLGSQMRQVLDGSGLVFETVHLANDGARIPVEVSSRRIEWDGGPVLFSLVRDIRERRAAEERIRFLNRLLRTISEVNQLVVRERDRDRLFAETCRILVEHGEFHMAWVGLAEPESGRVRPVAVAGFEEGYLAAHEVRFDDSPAGRGPTGTTIRERRAAVANDWEADERMAAWRAAGRERGYRASAAVPLESAGAAVGAVTVYADRAGVFTDEVVKLLAELAGDLSFALSAIEAERQKTAALAALAASEARFRELFGRIGSGVVVYEAVGDGEDFVIRGVNQAAERIENVEAATVIGRRVTEVFPGVVEFGLFDVFRRVWRSGEAQRHPVAIYRDERIEGWRENQVYKLPSGEVVSVYEDATERKLAEKAMSLLAAVVEFSDDAVIAKGLDGTILSWNAGAQRLYGYAATEAVGQNISFLAPPELRGDIQGIYDRVARGERVTHYETVRVRKDGTRVEVSLAVSQIRDSTGAIVGASTIARDITEWKQAEAMLKENEERFRTMADSLPQLAWIAKADGFIYWYNRRWFEYTGTTPRQMEGWGWQSVHDPNVLPRVLEQWQGSIATGRPFDMEFPLRGADGKFRPFLTRVMPLKDAQGRVTQWFGTNTDISERAAAEQAVCEANEQLEVRIRERTAELTDALQAIRSLNADLERRAGELEAANKELEAFSYSVSHDLRAPLRSIDGFSRIVEEEYGSSLDDEGRRLLRVVRDSTHKMAQLIDDLLAFSRSARHPLQPSRIDMGALARSVYEALIPPEARTRCEFTVGALPSAVGDAAMMRQVWVNLLANAVKFSAPATRPAIAVCGRVDGREVVYTVSDNGVGFDMTYAGKLFGVFQRLHPAREFEGTGVGLALVQRIVHRHGGRVWADGAVGKGAAFSFALPAPGGVS
jgi:PAS domain S-box-containing protein